MFAPSPGGPAGPTEIGACNPLPCIRASIGEVPALPTTLSPEFRASIDTQVKQVLYAPVDSDQPQVTSELLLTELKARYDEMTQPGVTDAPVDFEISRDATVLFENADVITIDVTSEGFLGGAHGFRERTLLVFDLKSGKRVTLAELVPASSHGIFEKLVEAQFRRAREIPAGESLSDAGYFVKPGGAIPIPDNFGITPGGLLIQYNPYEVAPYAFGPTEIVVPLEAFQGIVSDSSKGLISSLSAPARSGSPVAPEPSGRG